MIVRNKMVLILMRKNEPEVLLGVSERGEMEEREREREEREGGILVFWLSSSLFVCSQSL